MEFYHHNGKLVIHEEYEFVSLNPSCCCGSCCLLHNNV